MISEKGNIIVSIILILAVTVMGLGLLTYSLFHEKVVRARTRRLIASDRMYQDAILQIHQFREKVFGASYSEYAKPEEEFFTSDHFPDVVFHGNIFSHSFGFYKFSCEEFETLRIFDDFRVRSQRLPYGLNTEMCVSLVSGKILITMIPVVIRDKIVDRNQMGNFDESFSYSHQDSVAVELEILNFLLDSLDLPGPYFDWKSFRIRLNLEPDDNPPETGIYFICTEGVIKSIFIQGDVERIVFTVESDMQGISIVQRGIEYQLWYVPGTEYFLSWNEDPGFSGIFDERIIINGNVSFIGQEGGWAFAGDTALSLFVSGHLTLSNKLIGVPVHGEKYWTHLLIINSSKGFNGLQDSLAVIDDVDEQEGVRMDVSLVVQGKLINRQKNAEIGGSVYCSELENEGSIKIKGSTNRSSGGRFFHTEGMRLLQDFFVNFIEEDFGE